MIDIHSHIMPGIDDGASCLEESINLLKEAYRAGFSDIILTPHYMVGAYEPGKEIIEIKDILQKIADKNGIKINLYNGMEVYYTEEIFELIKNKKIASLANSRYILMELPLNNTVSSFEDTVKELRKRGIVVILAHPERYDFVKKNTKSIEPLLKSGCLLQCNYASILGYYGSEAKKALKELLKNNYVSFLGTDVHMSNTILNEIDVAIHKIKRIIGEQELIELIEENPRKILNKQ